MSTVAVVGLGYVGLPLAVEFGNRIDRALSERVLRLGERIGAARLGGVNETVATFRSLLVHYDPAHNAIVISRVFDHPRVPRYAVEYILFHEMLHLKHPVKLRGLRRCVHSSEFRAEEKMFPELEKARKFLRVV